MAMAFAAITPCTYSTTSMLYLRSLQSTSRTQTVNDLGFNRRPGPWTSNLHFIRPAANKVRMAVPRATNTDLEILVPSSSRQGFQTIQRVLQLRIVKIFALFSASLVISASLLCSSAFANTESIKASQIGLKIASFMRRSGWPDDLIVFVLATLPILELRGAIPVGYWMQLEPLKVSILAILGNMVPVPFILLYLKQLVSYAGKSSVASSFLDRLIEITRKKAGPIEEFQWLGLMLFVAVPFPGTGAWSGAIAATILDMPFWEAVSANFFGVVFAGLLMNLLVNLGIKYAVIVGAILFFVSTVMWSFLRYIRKPPNNSN